MAGAMFESRVHRGDRVEDLIRSVYDDKLGLSKGLNILCGGTVNYDKGPRLVLIGPKGTRLDAEMPLPEALDHEPSVPAEEEEGDFYPLSVLAGDAWRDLGLEGATRWRCLRENEFQKLFGMSKA